MKHVIYTHFIFLESQLKSILTLNFMISFNIKHNYLLLNFIIKIVNVELNTF